MTREEAIKILNTVLFIGKRNCLKEEVEECLNMAIKALEQEPSSSENPNRWIPCSERLPEDDEDVLVQMTDYSMMVDFRTASSSGWFWAEKDDLPIAWMPLPEPYKKEV